MIATVVHVYVKQEYLDEFIKATAENHSQSIQEAGNLRFDVIQDSNNPTKFILYEAYESEAAASTHKEMPHYFKWRDLVAPWMAMPREGIKHKILFPQNS